MITSLKKILISSMRWLKWITTNSRTHNCMKAYWIKMVLYLIKYRHFIWHKDINIQ